MNESQGYQSANWSEESIAAFWDYQSLKAPVGVYFSEGNREALVNLALWKGLIPCRIIDFGCGRGPLFQPLLELGCEVGGLEFSHDSAEHSNQKFSNNDKFLGVRLQGPEQNEVWEPELFDLCYCCEVIEHLTDEVLDPTFHNISRVLKPDGSLILTTPFDEKLSDHFIACPFCRTEYHHMQHVRSWNQATIREFLSSHGFTIDFCEAVDINRFQWGQPAGIRAKANAVHHQLQRTLRSLLGRDALFNYAARKAGPNLIVIARKNGNETS